MHYAYSMIMYIEWYLLKERKISGIFIAYQTGGATQSDAIF